MSKQVLSDMRGEARATTPSSAASHFSARFRNLSPLGVIVTRCEVAIAGLFLWAAYNKLFISANSPQLFSDSVRAFKLGLPDLLVRGATSMTPWIELVAGLALLLGIWARAAASIFAGLLILFIVLIVQALARGLDVNCGCFGKLSPFCSGPLGTCNIVQNSVMLAVTLVIVLTPRHLLASERSS